MEAVEEGKEGAAQCYDFLKDTQRVRLRAQIWIQVSWIPICRSTPPLFSQEEHQPHCTSNQAHVSPFSWRKLEEACELIQQDDGQVNYVLICATPHINIFLNIFFTISMTKLFGSYYFIGATKVRFSPFFIKLKLTHFGNWNLSNSSIQESKHAPRSLLLRKSACIFFICPLQPDKLVTENSGQK